MARQDIAAYHQFLAPTVPLSLRHTFKAPARFYMTGVVFIVYLNGHQDYITMIGGQNFARSAVHLNELFQLTDKVRRLQDPEVASRRAATVMAQYGIAWQASATAAPAHDINLRRTSHVPGIRDP
jgi:hypothetical protein